jgi:CRP/FNR family transcriptional regulator
MTATLTLVDPTRRSSMGAASFLSQLPAFARSRLGAIDELAELAVPRRLRRGERLWRQGEAANGVGVVRSGVLLLNRMGEEHDVALDICGRGCFVGVVGGARDDEAVAHEDSALLWWPRESFERWLATHPEMIPAVLELAGDPGRRLASRLALVTVNGARTRLARLLLDLSDRFGVRDSRGVIVDLRLTHREMAALIGATRETVSVAMVEMRAHGTVASEGRRVVLLDLPALREIAGR